MSDGDSREQEQMDDSAKQIISGPSPERPMSPADVLAQSLIALDAATRATLAAMQFCRDAGYFEWADTQYRRKQRLASDDAAREPERASTLDDLRARATTKSRAVFMKDKKQSTPHEGGGGTHG